MEARHSLGQANQGLQLSHSESVSGLTALLIGLPHLFVFIFEDLGGFSLELGSQLTSDLDEGLQLLFRELLVL